MRWKNHGVLAVAQVLMMVASEGECTSRVARPLDVRSDGEHVLGCIPADEGETVAVADAGISPAAIGMPVPPQPWQITFGEAGKPVVLRPGDCLASHHLPVGYEETAAPADVREYWPFSFSIRTAEWGRYKTRLHSGDFCAARRSGRLIVAQIPRTPEVPTMETCRRLLDAIK